MASIGDAALTDEVLPLVGVRRQRWPSPVWLIPLAAALVGLWLLFQYWYQQGDTITVRFPSAEGIEPGSTQVRYKAVTVGKVKSVTLNDKLEPLVTLALNKDISAALECSAQFWVVRPRIRGAEISGLGTLFSGTYVGMTPSREGGDDTGDNSLLCYEVLEEPPASKPNRPGRELKLMTDSMGSLDIGTPVFYKQLQVGEVINYRLSADSGRVELSIFVDDPYYRLITESTRFWDVSGVDFKMDSVGAEIRMESLTSLLIGGIAFDTPTDQPSNLPVSGEGSVFELFPDYASSREKRYQERLYYTLYFNGSVRGLVEKAPVEFQGIRVGQVEKIKMHLDPQSLDVRIPVLVSVEPQRFSEDIRLEEAPALMEELVSRGMRAKLQNGNLLTGQMFIALSFEDKPKPDSITKGQFYDVFPTTPTPVEELSRMAVGIADDMKGTLAGMRRFMESGQLDKTVVNINKVLGEAEGAMVEAKKALADARLVIQDIQKQTLPNLTQNVEKVSGSLTRSLESVTGNVDKVSGSLTRSLDSVTGEVGKVSGSLTRSLESVTGNVDKVSGTVNRSLGSISGSVSSAGQDFSRTSLELDQTMQRLQTTLTHLDRLLAKNSPTQYQLLEMMEEITSMSRSVRTLTETLQRQPEALIRGKTDWDK